MRVVHLATSLHGGAGKAAYRIHRALLASGIDSEVITLTGPTSAEIDPTVHIVNRSSVQKLKSYANTFFQRELLQNGPELVTPISLSVIGDFLDKLEDCDVLHLHNIYNLTNISEIALRFGQKKRIVLTLHDQRAVTGGCHYSGSCSNFLDRDCQSCPLVRQIFTGIVNKRFKDSKSAYSIIQDISVVAPSNWLLNKAKKAPMIESAKFYLIRNPIAETFHKDFKRDKSRRKRVLAFIALDLQNPFKGLDVYARALNRIATPEWFLDKKLVFLGRGNLPPLPKAADVEKISIEDESELHEKLLGVDLVVVPSNQDNFPNVIPEALLSGCALITSDAGGVSELSKDFNYEFFPAGDADALRLLLESHQFNERATEERAEKAQEMFSSKVIAKLYEHVYKI